MPSLNSLLVYLFYPNPGSVAFTNPKALTLLIVCAVMVVASFFLRRWRTRLGNPVTRRLSRSWPTASFWFGLTGCFLVFSRMESISYVSIRFLWVLWAVFLALYLIVQVRVFRARHYEVLPAQRTEDPRSRYLPKRKKKK
ncbi:MAG: hypothetical protein PHO92_03555 [Candidatus Peribacteraceae bacterium]|nr:hypothetical protein [Candidatus Peribacteraceae bacterium]